MERSLEEVVTRREAGDRDWDAVMSGAAGWIGVLWPLRYTGALSGSEHLCSAQRKKEGRQEGLL